MSEGSVPKGLTNGSNSSEPAGSSHADLFFRAMNDAGRKNFTPARSDEAPLTENDELFETAVFANEDGKLTRRELDALVATNYGRGLPLRSRDQMTREALLRDGLILDPNDTEQVTVQQFRNDRVLAQNGLYVHDGDKFQPGTPADIVSTRESLQNTPIIGDAKAAGAALPTTGRAYVDKAPGSVETGATGLHEVLHLYAHPRVLTEASMPMREGMTEYFTYQTIDGFGGSNQRRSGYHDWTVESFRLRGIVGQEAMEKAYFGGDFAQLKQKYEERVGEGSWAAYTRTLETTQPEKLRSAVDDLLWSSPEARKDGEFSIGLYETIYQVPVEEFNEPELDPARDK